jgi:hypothetical protein
MMALITDVDDECVLSTGVDGRDENGTRPVETIEENRSSRSALTSRTVD